MDGALSNTMRWFSLISLWKLIIEHSLGTDSCINATCRFVCRRGQVTNCAIAHRSTWGSGKPESDKKCTTPSYQRASGGNQLSIRAAYGKDKSALQAQTTVTRWWRWSVTCEVKAITTNRAITQASNNPLHKHRGTSCKEEETWPSQLLNHGPSSDRDVSGTVKRVSVWTKTFWTDLTNCWSKQCDQLFTIRTLCKNYNGCLLNILWLFV